MKESSKVKRFGIKAIEDWRKARTIYGDIDSLISTSRKWEGV